MHRYSLLGFGKDVNDGVSNCARRSFLVKSEMRSLNLGKAAIALSNVVLVIFCVVEGINDGGVKEFRHLPSPFRET